MCDNLFYQANRGPTNGRLPGQFSVLFKGKSIGHAGDIISNRPQESDLLPQILELWRKQFRLVRKDAEQLSKGCLRLFTLGK